MPSLGLGYIAAYLREHIAGLKIKIISFDIENHIKRFQPELIGITSVSQNFGHAIKIAKICKKHNLPVIVGGQHISALPGTLSEDMDIGIMREGEDTFREIVEIAKSGWDIKKVRKIKGIAYKQKGKLIQTTQRELIKPLDNLPHPAYDLLEFQKGGQFPIFSSRGCPYNCQFCSSTRFWNSVRFFSAEYVVEEIKMIVKRFRPSLITFQDDLFVADKKRLAKIVQLLRKANIHKKVAFHVSCRANLVTDELIETLQKMNVTNVFLGLESGSEKTLKWLKGNVTMAMNRKAVKIISRHRINVNATFIIGAPYETKKDIMQTFNFIKNSPINLFQVYGLVPYPGTPVWDFAVKKGVVSIDMDWEQLSQDFEHNPDKKLNLCENLSKKEVYDFYIKFERLRKYKYAKTLVINAIRHPDQILPYIKRKVWEHRTI